MLHFVIDMHDPIYNTFFSYIKVRKDKASFALPWNLNISILIPHTYDESIDQRKSCRSMAIHKTNNCLPFEV